MASYDYDSCQHIRAGLQLDDGDEVLKMLRWPGSSLMFQQSYGSNYHVSNPPQLAEDRNHTISPAHYPFSNLSYPSYHTPSEDLQPPYFSSPSSLYNSSSASSDRLSPSIGSRASSLLPSPNPCHIEVIVPQLDFTSSYSNGPYADPPCVSMHAVQKQADTTLDDPIDHSVGYGHYGPQEVVPVSVEYDEPTLSTYGQLPNSLVQQDAHEDSASDPEPALESEPESDYQPNPAPTMRRRRAPKLSSSAATRGHNGANKRRLTQQPSKPSRSLEGTPRAFLCPLAPYGCPSSFNAKNEWKRHALTQHFRLGFWRCDQCTDSPDRPNDFNRKDLFIQHVRRMHPTNTAVPTTNNNSSKKKARAHGRVAAVEAALNKIAARCYQRTLSAPESCCCVFCEEKFEGDGAMESRIEHVGKHMESRRRNGLYPVAVADWNEDKELEAWSLLHGMIVKRKGVLEVSR